VDLLNRFVRPFLIVLGFLSSLVGTLGRSSSSSG